MPGTVVCFPSSTESAIISGPDSALRELLSCYCGFVARLVKVPVITRCLTAPSGLCNLGTSWNEAKPGASFMQCHMQRNLALLRSFAN